MHNSQRSYQQFIRGAIAFLAACFLTAGAAQAAGTPAGTIITNTATMNYKLSGASQPPVSSSNQFVVDRFVNLVVTKNLDAIVAPGSLNQALLFLATNTSNTAIRFALSPVSKATNTWTMNNVRIFADTNNNGVWDAGDTPYTDASTFGEIASGGSITVLIVADTPVTVGTGEAAQYDLVATAVDAGTVNVSTQTAGPNTPGVDTVFLDSAGSAIGDGTRDGKHSAVATYSVTTSVTTVSLVKSVTILDQWGGNLPIPGATLRYTIVATATGIGTANNVVFSDPLPLNTTYIANTLRLDNAPVGPAIGDVGTTTPDTVTVRLGNMTSSSSQTHTVQFDVKIQ